MSASTFPNADATSMDARRPPFDSVTIAFHWATVLIVLAMFASAWLHMQSHDHAFKAILLQIHRSLGVTIWVATALRLAWRLTKAKLPPFPQNMPKVQQRLAKASEYGLYALLLVQSAIGLAATLVRGGQFTIFSWQIPQLIPKDLALLATFDLAHKLGAWALGALILGHAAAALIHHFVLCDDVLQCMAPVVATEPHEQGFLPGRVIRSHHLREGQTMFTLARRTITTLVVSFSVSAWFDGKEVEAAPSVRRTALTSSSPTFGRTNGPASRWLRNRRRNFRSRRT